ncbi:hypothetical protein [Nonomuraea sp. CA-141351]|uniref:hypothetical protein n=1 Tax=Nonomuraea sp. CA-141351 TaxID=3239996 RepID=UPI003D8B6A47
MGRDLLMRAAVFGIFTLGWVALGGSARLLWPAVIVVAFGLALHAWVKHRADK